MSTALMLKQDEGYKTKVYWDTEGYPTIGIGHLILHTKTKDINAISQALSSQVGRSVVNAITDQEAELLFAQDLNALQYQILNHPKLVQPYNSLDNVRRTALENMVFQLGANGVSKFPSMLKSILAGDYNSAYKHGLDSLWARQTPNRAKRVLAVLRDGNYSGYDFA